MAPSLIISDADATTLTSATVSVSAGFTFSDTLSAVNTPAGAADTTRTLQWVAIDDDLSNNHSSAVCVRPNTTWPTLTPPCDCVRPPGNLSICRPMGT